MDTKTLIRNISMIVGIAATGFAGLFFILFVDIYLKGTSVELFIGIILSLASIVLFVLSESFKHKPYLFYIFKGLAIAAVIGFVVYAFAFMGFDRYVNGKPVFKLFKTYNDVAKGKTRTVFFLNSTKFNDGIVIQFGKQGPYIFMLIIGIIGCIGEAVNTVMNKLVGLD